MYKDKAAISAGPSRLTACVIPKITSLHMSPKEESKPEKSKVRESSQRIRVAKQVVQINVNMVIKLTVSVKNKSPYED